MDECLTVPAETFINPILVGVVRLQFQSEGIGPGIPSPYACFSKVTEVLSALGVRVLSGRILLNCGSMPSAIFWGLGLYPNGKLGGEHCVFAELARYSQPIW